MADTIVEFFAPSGLTLTLSLYTHAAPDTLANSGGADSCTERSSAKGTYTATVTEAVTGLCNAVVTISGGAVLGCFVVEMADDTEVHRPVSRQLPSNGLDLISTAEPSGVASNFREMLVQTFRAIFGKSARAITDGTGTIKRYKSDGTTVATMQAITDDGEGNETIGEAEAP